MGVGLLGSRNFILEDWYNPIIMKRLIKVVFASLLIVVSADVFAQTVTLAPVKDHSGTNISATFTSYTTTEFSQFLVRSDSFRARFKLLGFDATNATGTPNTKWDLGTWGQGYYSYYRKKNYYVNNVTTDNEYNTEDDDYNSEFYTKTRSATPRVDLISKFIRAHIHTFLVTGNSTHLSFAKNGVDYLLSEQISGGDHDGGWMRWDTRDSQSGGTSTQNTTSNIPHIYPASYAVRALVEFYLASGNTYISGNSTYADAIYDAIDRGAIFIAAKTDYSGNYNYLGICAWALASAYKVTHNCNSYNSSMSIADFLVGKQDTTSGSMLEGQWSGIQPEDAKDPGNHQYWHDNKIEYHTAIIRGLVETLDIALGNAGTTFQTNLLNAIKKGLNHIIKYRLYVTLKTTDTQPNILYLTNYTDGSPALENWTYDKNGTGSPDVFEAMYFLLYYSKLHPGILSSGEESTLLTLINYTAKNLEWMPPGNPHNDRARLYYFTTAAEYSSLVTYGYGGFGSGNRVFEWQHTGYKVDRVADRIVSFDFNNDNQVNDIAAFYDNGGGRTNLHVWTSAGDHLVFSGCEGKWTPTSPDRDLSYDVTKINGRVVSGDFDNDGYKDDIAALYRNGSFDTKIHVWLFSGGSFTYQSTPWWSSTGYEANLITDRVVSGDFDNDGYKDDIAAFYRNGNYSTTLHVWRYTGCSGGTCFTYSGGSGWWSNSGYEANQITGRVVAGNFDNTGGEDIATFYDNGSSHTNLHVFTSQGTYFSYSGGATGWWIPTAPATDISGYDVTKITGRVVAGNFYNGNSMDDIAAFYDKGSGHTNLHVWKSTGSVFTYAGATGWWAPPSGQSDISNFDVNQITGRVVSGNFYTTDSRDDIIAFFRNSDSEVTTYEWKSNGTAFNDPSVLPWWLEGWTTPTGRIAAPEIVTAVADEPQVESKTQIVYPNPATHTLFIKSPADQKVTNIELLSSTGQRILSTTVNEDGSVDVSTLSRGLYLVKVKVTNGFKTEKILLH
jgi:hypothetical protein